ncbi:FtsK/SpoIIIE domain-containing protein, partial [Actinotalea fermentans]|uniref:FtsK/SpoIIIE domain-containing protein n=1 Tax=Actinotalea fermentans TaxID=43671 RepID=UPI0011BFE3AA
MRIKLTLERLGGQPVDLVVTADAGATVGDVAEALVEGNPDPHAASPGGPVTLRLHTPDGAGLLLDAAATVEGSGVRSGGTVRVERVGGAVVGPGEGRPPAVAVLRVLAGPDEGREFPLPAGATVVGRDRDVAVRLSDPMVSKRHARINVADTVEIVDLGSANGVVVDGVPVPRVPLESGGTVLLGDTVLTVVLLQRPADRAQATTVVPFVRPPRVVPAVEEREIAAPTVPQPSPPRRFPLVAMVAPLLMGAILFTVTRNALSLMFVALSPVIMVGTWLDARLTARRQFAAATEQFHRAILAAREEVDAAHRLERVLRCAQHPSTAELTDAVVRYGPLLWSRRPEHEEFLTVRLGTGDVRSRCTITGADAADGAADVRQALRDLVEHAGTVTQAPVVANLRKGGNLGIAGPRQHVAELAGAIALQLVALHSPAELSLAAVVPARSSADWRWLPWLPHTGSAHAALGSVPLLADDAGAAVTLVAALEELVAARRGGAARPEPRGRVAANPGAAQAEEPPFLPSVVLVVEDGAPVDRARLTAIAENGPDVNVHVVWVAATADALPAACREFVVVDAEGRATAGAVRPGELRFPVVIERLAAADAPALARLLAPVEDAGAVVEDQAGLPQSVSFLALVGPELGADPGVQLERWRESGSLGRAPGGVARAGSLRAIVGQGVAGPMVLDLREQGPHALVGGTTGAGKSEFLQSWVLGMASAHSPSRVTFLLVDYKGGAAFADCVRLPHTVGLVTDLSPHLVRRALTSLRAELRFREGLLNAKEAKDLLALEKRGDPDTPPSLVIVVDEFAALATEVPEFVDGVVDVAQRGRSLGLHLILATQRPAGVIRDNLRANTNLRVALRMADEDDSNDVLGSPLAAHVDPGLPGRGAVRTGPGRIVTFQSAYAGGRTP